MNILSPFNLVYLFMLPLLSATSLSFLVFIFYVLWILLFFKDAPCLTSSFRHKSVFRFLLGVLTQYIVSCMYQTASLLFHWGDVHVFMRV
jgi:hypothetical protein